MAGSNALASTKAFYNKAFLLFETGALNSKPCQYGFDKPDSHGDQNSETLSQERSHCDNVTVEGRRGSNWQPLP
jgi:hypothetical protein